MLNKIENIKSSTLKLILVVSSLLISVIIIIQLVWLNKLFQMERKDFNTDVSKAVRGFYEDVGITEIPGYRLSDYLFHVNPTTFLIRLDSVKNPDTAELFLAQELEDFNVYADYEVAFYNCSLKRYTYKAYRPTPTGKQIKDNSIQLPLYERNFNYMALLFPHRSGYLLKGLAWWIAGSLLLVMVLVAFGVIVYFFYRQKFLNELQKDFVNNFTHEFKTPLSVMKIAADVLAKPAILEQPERLQKYTNVLEEQILALQNKTERLLQTVKADSARLVMDKEPVVINQLIQKSVENMDPLLREKQAIIEFQPEEKNLTITGDPLHLSMMVVNLLENAIKYSRNPKVYIETRSENGHYQILVKDNGIGIEKKYLHRIFNKFFRVPTGNVHNVKGFGLGLHYVKRIVDEHHGTIKVNSIVGIGSEFIITLSKKSLYDKER